MSLLFNILSRFVIAFPRSKCLLITWLQSWSTVILKPKKIKPVTIPTFSPSIFHEVAPILLSSDPYVFKKSLIWGVLTTSNLPWFMDLTNIPGSYAVLFFTASDFTFTTGHMHSWALFPLWHSALPLFSSSILDIFQPGGIHLPMSYFLPFYTVHGVLKARILKWVAISSSSRHDFSELSTMTLTLGWICMAWLIASLIYASSFATTRLWSIKGNHN